MISLAKILISRLLLGGLPWDKNKMVYYLTCLNLEGVVGGQYPTEIMNFEGI